ncbi:MAG TPA: hypothetical protein VE972_00050 [Conexibacter sp.]|nr:hypothetical protein [Conexibacter sp.]
MNSPGADGNRSVATRDQQLRVFFSADLVNGTDFKSRRPTEQFPLVGDRPAWPSRFAAFFTDFNRDFGEAVDAERSRVGAQGILARPRLWKLNGDELLFTELVYPDDHDQVAGFASSVRAFIDVVADHDERMVPEGTGVHGCIWTAGFPIRNRMVRISQGDSIPIIRDTSTDFEMGAYAPPPATVMDYIGRDMDLGFRLAAATPPGRVSCSLDVAGYLFQAPEHRRPNVFLVGWRRLKGIGGGHPYPFLLVDVEPEPAERHPWERDDEQTSVEIRRLLNEPDTVRLTADHLGRVATTLREQLPDHYIQPYASDKEMAKEHTGLWATGRVPGVLDVSTAAPETPARDDVISVLPSSVPTITMDDLNQLQMLLQTEDGLVASLRKVLDEIVDHEAYSRWEMEPQFEGRLFRMPPGLIFVGDEQRRLLEKLRLVEDDVLRVKINRVGSQLFLTDGLWVSGEIRAMPFHDESDLLWSACERLGWRDWPTCVVDPATGCGHSLLRYDDAAVRRHGFDINARSISYAAINRMLNSVGFTVLGLSNIEAGLPCVFEQGIDERVLAVVNMPFALVPEPDLLPRSAAGGRYGCELTLKAVDQIAKLATTLAGASSLRCLLLTYTLGRLAEDVWMVPDYVADVFGADRCTFRLCEEEMLWRINGRKEQPNPMPLELLELKASCRFYVRYDADRAAVAARYRTLTRDLLAEGWDHLGYGVVAIDAEGGTGAKALHDGRVWESAGR